MQRMLPCGEHVPALGQGTWNLGEDPPRRREEIAALRRGLDLGLTLVDTAEVHAALLGPGVRQGREGMQR